jgi:hypothetical protein
VWSAARLRSIKKQNSLPGKEGLYHKYLKKSNHVNMELAPETIEKYASQYF